MTVPVTSVNYRRESPCDICQLREGHRELQCNQDGRQGVLEGIVRRNTDPPQPGCGVGQDVSLRRGIQGVDLDEAACRLHTASEVSGPRRGSCEGVAEDSGGGDVCFSISLYYILFYA